MQQQLIYLNSENLEQKESYLKIAYTYLDNRYKDEQVAESFMNNQTLKAVFNILIKLSYGLFAVGVILTVQTQAVDQQKFMIYLQSTRSQVFLIILLLMGVFILSILKVVKEDNKIAPKTKKILNFIVDIIRTMLYVLSLVFVQPFVYDNSEGFLMVSFWIFAIATVLFFGRKVAKWAYYLFDKKGKLILDPWFNSDIEDAQNMAKLAQYIEFVLKKEISGGLMQNDIISTQKQQQLKKIQEKFQTNFEEKGKLLIEMNKIFHDKII